MSLQYLVRYFAPFWLKATNNPFICRNNIRIHIGTAILRARSYATVSVFEALCTLLCYRRLSEGVMFRSGVRLSIPFFSTTHRARGAYLTWLARWQHAMRPAYISVRISSTAGRFVATSVRDNIYSPANCHCCKRATSCISYKRDYDTTTPGWLRLNYCFLPHPEVFSLVKLS